MTADRPLRLGSRGSPLALAQARIASEAIRATRSGLRIEIVTITTSGDRSSGAPFAEIGPRGVFAAELRRALVDGAIDAAVHSLKDLPVEEDDALSIAAVLPRGEVGDALVSRAGTLAELAPGARVGTSSLRRRALVAAQRPDVEVVPLRGNVGTRVRKVDDGEVDAAVLAGAGLARLGMSGRVTEWLGPPGFLPAPGQGAVVIEVASQRLNDDLSFLAGADDPASREAVGAERTFTVLVEGGCSLPLGAWARHEDAVLVCDGFVSMPDGSRMLRGSARGPDAGRTLAGDLLSRGADEILSRLRDRPRARRRPGTSG